MSDPLILGRAYLDGGNYTAAKEQAEKALSLSPESDSAWALLHSSVKKSKGLKGGREIAEKWLKTLPDSKDALEQLTLDTILLRKDRNKSRSLLENYQLKYPDAKDEIKLQRCFFEVIFGDKNTATELAQEFTGGNKTLSGFLIFEGLINYEADCCREAYHFGRNAVRLAPEEPHAWRLLAISAFREMRFNEARRAALNAQKLDPTLPGMKIIKMISPLGWFPLFFLGSLISLITLRFACALKVKGAIRSILGIACSYVLTVYALLPILRVVAAQLSGLGFPNLIWVMFSVLLAWLFIPEMLFNYSESDKHKTPSPTQLKKY